MTHLNLPRESNSIVHVAAHYPPSLGGLERVVEALAVGQTERGVDVEVLTSLDGQSRIRGGSKTATALTVRSSASEGIAQAAPRIRRFRSWNLAHTPVMPGLAIGLLRLPRRSIIHLHVAQAFVPEAVFLAHILRGHRYVAHLHLDVGPSGRAGFLLRAWKPLVLGPILRRAAMVVVFTQEQRATTSARYRISPDRITAIPNGVDLVRFNAGERTLHHKPRLLFVGRLTAQKNLPLFLRALSGVSMKFETTIVGEGELETTLRQAAAGMGLQNVRFHGRADGPELLDLYRGADVLVMPSEREGMPLVLLEAIAMGLPIVATDVPGNRDVVVDGRNGFLVPVGDPDRFRQALLAATGDNQRYQRMSETSRNLAAQYSWDAIEDRFDRIYRDISAKKQSYVDDDGQLGRSITLHR